MQEKAGIAWDKWAGWDDGWVVLLLHGHDDDDDIDDDGDEMRMSD